MPEFLLRPGDEHPLAAQLRELLGVSTYEEVTVVTPQFERTDGRTVVCRPTTADSLDRIKKLPHEVLLGIGLGIWDANEAQIHYLFPKEWYSCIPDGYPVTDIFGETEQFKFGVSDNDKRFGCLPYGFIRARQEADGQQDKD